MAMREKGEQEENRCCHLLHSDEVAATGVPRCNSPAAGMIMLVIFAVIEEVIAAKEAAEKLHPTAKRAL